MGDEAGETPEILQIPLDRPTPARIYDYLLGGKDHFEVDRIAAEQLMALAGEAATRGVAWENRRFLWRAVQYLAGECGIDQFIDVGAGLPTMRNTHEIAQELIPAARVVYADNDPIVLAHGRALLARNGATTVIAADMRDPASILDAPETKALIDFSRPVAVLVLAAFHFVPSAGHPRYREGDADPAGIMAAFRERLAPGSYAAVTHLSSHGVHAEAAQVTGDVYEKSTAPLIYRDYAQVAALFDGWELVPPRIVNAWKWRALPTEYPRSERIWAGVGRRA
jgi:hypothetical protein